jgi:hypothetical protein
VELIEPQHVGGAQRELQDFDVGIQQRLRRGPDGDGLTIIHGVSPGNDGWNLHSSCHRPTPLPLHDLHWKAAL